jgi:hypothetical protein
MNLRKESTREEFEGAFAQCKPEDFDGHTGFYRLTPEQRLSGVSGGRLRSRVQRQSANGCETRDLERFRIDFPGVEVIGATTI